MLFLHPTFRVFKYSFCSGVVESREDDELRAERQKASNYKYAKSWLALALPVAYCLLDAAGTFADTLVLDTLAGEAEAAGLFATAEECSSYAASVSNCAYELTFLLSYQKSSRISTAAFDLKCKL
jgi:hypothetical protein